MTERPSAGALAAIVALAFVVAFAAAAVLRPQTASSRRGSVTAPAAAGEAIRTARVGRPSLSRVAALPQLRLPVVRHHRPARPAEPVVTAATPAAVATATPVPSATPPPAATAVPTAVVSPRPVAPATPAKPATPKVGQTFDSSG